MRLMGGARVTSLAIAAVGALSACSSSPLAGEPNLEDASDSASQDSYDAGRTGYVDSGGDSTTTTMPPGCASAPTGLTPASTATSSGPNSLACGAVFAFNNTFENCYCPPGDSCPDDVTGIPGTWNPMAGCGFCMAPSSVLCGVAVGTAYSCPATSTCVPLDGSVPSFSCCPAGQTCPTLCDGVCVPGATRCTSNAVETCGDDDVWGPASPCTGQACVAGACVGVCTPGPAECGDGGVATCDSNGQWNFSPCVSSTCVGGVCSGSCSPGSVQCAGNGAQTCDSTGNWGSPAACTDQTCVNGQCAGACSPDQVRCNGAQPQACDSTGAWASAGSACAQPSPDCSVSGSEAICACGGVVCAGTCVEDEQTDPNNCGACGVVCPSGPCSQGQCDTTVTTGASGNSPIAVNATTVSWEDYTGITSMPLGGGAFTTIATTPGEAWAP
jgi:hypothetical protein